MLVGLTFSLGAAVPTGPLLPRISVASGPVIQEDIEMGVLRLDPLGSITPSDAVVTLQWLRNGEPISGETGTEYTKSAMDAGNDLGLAIWITKSGYAPLRLHSNTLPIGSPNWQVVGTMIMDHPPLPTLPQVTATLIEV